MKFTSGDLVKLFTKISTYENNPLAALAGENAGIGEDLGTYMRY